MAVMAIVFFQSPSSPAITAAPIRISTMVAVICSQKIFNGVRPPFSTSSLGP